MSRLRRLVALAAPLALVAAASCSGAPEVEHSTAGSARTAAHPSEKELTMTETEEGKGDGAGRSSGNEALATFGAGCFWCVEAVLEQYDGVLDVRSGYMGGEVANPTYRAVCTGTTGHAEVVQVRFDPSRISYESLLDLFFQLHDPTTLNRQGADVGTQYRSVVFFHDAEQERAARASVEAHADDFDQPIVTEISPASAFYEAEDYHQDYYRLNKSQPYCRAVIRPKLDKLGLEK